MVANNIAVYEKEKFISTPIEMNSDDKCQRKPGSMDDNNIISRKQNKTTDFGKVYKNNIGANIFQQAMSMRNYYHALVEAIKNHPQIK